VHLLVEIPRGPTADYIIPKIKENGQELSEIRLFVRVLGLSGMVGDDSIYVSLGPSRCVNEVWTGLDARRRTNMKECTQTSINLKQLRN
jgi:hypothetical protein